jgi:hypothetical protein
LVFVATTVPQVYDFQILLINELKDVEISMEEMRKMLVIAYGKK